MISRLVFLLLLLLFTTSAPAAELRVGVFDVDATPPIGSPMAYNPVKGVTTPLSCRGIVIVGSGDPIVMCAVDWIGIGNEGQTVFREKLAAAARTDAERVVVHALHQHDAPRCDFTAEAILASTGLTGVGFDTSFARSVIERAAAAVATAVQQAQPVTQIGLGQGTVEKVASNRRILGPDGKVLHTRYTATSDPKIRAFPAGTIDAQLKMISFWNQDDPIVALTYYATHPQSYYRTGLATPDFPGLARNARQSMTGVPHVHFNGAGGTIGAGKWNDGSKENRQVLADRVADGMRLAWENTDRSAVTADDIKWATVPVLLPLASHVNENTLAAKISDESLKPLQRFYTAVDLAWARRTQAADPITIACLTVRKARVLHMPGELFVEYQLKAQSLRPDLFVAMAAYGDYAPGYIGTEIAYSQGGYETSERASRVAPGVERVLNQAMKTLLDVK